MINLALEVAAKAHLKQKRKGTKIPYIVHPVGVGIILAQYGYPEELVVAGLLHDTVEDTSVSIKFLKETFGERITSIVEGCTEPNRFLSWEKRKKHTIEFLRGAPIEIRIVACADKLHNLRSIVHAYADIGDKVWNRFKKGKEQQEWYYKGLVESLFHDTENRNSKLFLQLKTEVELFFDNIKSVK